MFVFQSDADGSSIDYTPKKVGEIKVVWALGDSILAGTNTRTIETSSSDNFGAYLAKQIGAEYHDLAVANSTSNDVLYQAKSMGFSDLTIIMVGPNDIFQGRSEEEFKRNIGAIVDEAKPKSRRVVLVGLPDFERLRQNFDSLSIAAQFYKGIVDNRNYVGQFEVFDKIIEKISRDKGVDYLPISQVKFERSDLGADSFHPGTKGHGKIARMLEEKLPGLKYCPNRLRESLRRMRHGRKKWLGLTFMRWCLNG
ncbi:MAG: SGNH/GDSL hydrolase family protein [Candidatus Micrarchaeota archaeon]